MRGDRTGGEGVKEENLDAGFVVWYEFAHAGGIHQKKDEGIQAETGLQPFCILWMIYAAARLRIP
jgi:hypothetical protein